MNLKEALQFLACPSCGGDLYLSKKILNCRKCGSSYAVVDEVPVLLDEKNLGDQERSQIKWFNNHYSGFSGQKYFLENWRESMLKRIFENKPANTSTYLDIGCGATGYTAIEAAKQNGWQSFGIDISLEAMLRAKSLATKQEVADKTFFLVASIEALPFKKAVFDYVSAISVLEHIENDQRALDKIAKSTKKGGKLYVCVPNTYRRMWLFLWPIYRYIDYKIGHKRHYSEEGLVKKANMVKFKKIKVFYNAHLIKFVQMILEKTNLLDKKNWWRLEKKDINSNNMGIQLNAIFRKL